MVSGFEHTWSTLIAVCTAIFVLLLDVTVVNVTLPDIQRDVALSGALLVVVLLRGFLSPRGTAPAAE